MIRLSPNIPNPHEAWCLRLFLPLCGKLRTHERFRKNRVVDAILHMPDPDHHWGPLATYLTRRDVLIEHFSDSVSTLNFASCREKIAYASYRYLSLSRKERGQVLHPSMVILTRRRPDKLLAEPEIFKPTQHPGIWINGSWELGPIIVVSSTRLPEEPEFDWMRMCVRVPDNLEDVERATALIKRSKTDKLTRQRLEETMFDFMYVDGVHFLEYAEKLKEEHEARLREAEEKARIEAELRYTTEIQQLKADLAALKAKIDDQEKST